MYTNYSINPTYAKKFFDKIIIKYDTAVNKKSKEYWDTIRPVPLEQEEKKDYIEKDSIFQVQKDSSLSKRSIDSLKKKQGKIKPLTIFLKGINRTHYSKINTLRLPNYHSSDFRIDKKYNYKKIRSSGLG